MYGETYICDHPAYHTCTLFKIRDNGLAVIQQRFDPVSKKTWWGELDPWLTDDLYLHKGFMYFFNDRSGKSEDGLYPTVTIRPIMWAIKMKPLPKNRWKTRFDRRYI